MADQDVVAGTIHLNGSKSLDNLLSYLKLESKKIRFDKKKKSGLNEGPVIVTSDESIISGLNTVSKLLVIFSDKHDLLGKSEYSKIEVDQWLDYCQCNITPVSDDIHINKLCKELDDFLDNKSFFVDDQVSLADLILYTHLNKKMHVRSQAEHENHINLSRWFNQIQNLGGVRHKLPFVSISRTLLYS